PPVTAALPPVADLVPLAISLPVPPAPPSIELTIEVEDVPAPAILPPSVVEGLTPPPSAEATPVLDVSPVIAPEPTPIPLAPPPAPGAPAAEPPPVPDYADGIRRIAAGLRPVGRFPVTTHTLMGITLFAACSPRLAQEAVVSSAFRFLTALME